jgi:hypothetical protein
MIRFLISAAVWLGASAVGLIIAVIALPDMSIDVTSFIEIVVIFAILQALLTPFMMKMAAGQARALLGGAGLFATLIALIITKLISSGLHITGLGTWVLAAVIIWIAGMIASWLLPFLLVRNAVDNSRDRRSAA